MSTISYLQEKLNEMSRPELFSISENLILSPIMKNQIHFFKYLIPDIVLKQPEDWEYYVKLNGDDIYYSSENQLLTKDSESLSLDGKATFVQYLIVRRKTTAKKVETPIEKLTKQVEELTKMVKEMNDNKDLV
jgi:hypothetical protein